MLYEYAEAVHRIDKEQYTPLLTKPYVFPLFQQNDQTSIANHVALAMPLDDAAPKRPAGYCGVSLRQFGHSSFHDPNRLYLPANQDLQQIRDSVR